MLIIRPSVITATTPTAIYSVTDVNAIRVYPNPVSDQMKISFAKLPLNNFSITLNDITGKTILKQHFPASANDLSFNLKDVAKGIYVLHISNNDFEKVTKIIVE